MPARPMAPLIKISWTRSIPPAGWNTLVPRHGGNVDGKDLTMCTHDGCPTPARREVLKTGAALLALGLTSSGAPADTLPVPLGETVHFQSSAGAAAGYLALPTSSAPAPAVLITHGEIGVPESHRLVAGELADAGFCALVVQRFSRIPGFGWDQIRADNAGDKHFLSEAHFHEEQQDALGAIAFLQNHPRVRASKMGAVGFCGGGIQAVRLSLATPALGAVVSFYGPPVLPPQYKNATDPIHDLVEFGSLIRTPLQIHYGTADYAVKAADVERLAAQVRGAGTEIEVWSYDGATHAFYDRTNAQAWNAERGALAHDRYIGFLKKHLV